MVITSCSNTDEPQPDPTPNDKDIMYEVKLNFNGDIPDLIESEEPISRADAPSPKRVYGINVWCMKTDGTDTSYKNYAYGLFDNKEDMVISLLDGYKYRFECYMVEDDEDELYISPSKYTGKYPYNCKEIKNTFVIGSGSSGFHFDDTNITTVKSQSYYNTESAYQELPAIGIYYGMLGDYIPSKTSSATIPIYKIGYYGLRIIVSEVPDGELFIDPYHFGSIIYDDEENHTIHAYSGNWSKIFSQPGSMEKMFVGGFYSALSDADWLSKMKNYTKEADVCFYWTHANGYTQYFYKTITLKRNVMTVLTVNLAGESNDVSFGIEEHGDEMITEYDSVDMIQGEESRIPEDMTIAFPDEKFRNYLLQNFDTNNNGVLSEEEALQVKEIKVNALGITSLEGIQYFLNLERLYCVNNKLTKLDVSKNIALTHLQCYYNDLTSIDVTKNLSLTQLWIWGNFATNSRLSSLDVSHNIVLTDLRCYDNNLESLGVSNNKALKTLHCGHNKLTNLDITKNTALTSLQCGYNQLTNLDISNNTALKQLYCYQNKLTSLDVSKNTNLSDFLCDYNQLTNLDISKNTQLTRLNCGNNQITSLDVSNITTLEELRCNSNQLTSLDVSKNTTLEVLWCGGNYLTSLDVSNTRLDKGIEHNAFPLSCHMSTLRILYLKEGWNIEGININRSTDCINSNTEITYID